MKEFPSKWEYNPEDIPPSQCLLTDIIPPLPEQNPYGIMGKIAENVIYGLI